MFCPALELTIERPPSLGAQGNQINSALAPMGEWGEGQGVREFVLNF
jgi:hypothetical protein